MRPSLAALTRARARLPVPRGPAVTVLGYHRVDLDGGGLAVRPATFAAQMEALDAGRDRLPVLGLAEAVGAVHGGTVRQAVVLTFDDAWADNYTHALGPLVDHALPATLYAPSRLLSTPGYLSVDQLREMSAAGVAIGAHTRTHPDLRRCTDRELLDEIRGSRDDLEDLLQQPVDSFAYPTGHHDDRVVAVVAAAGYRTAVTTRRGWLRPATYVHRIPRSFVEDFDLRTFVATARGGMTVLRVVDQIKNVAARTPGRAPSRQA